MFNIYKKAIQNEYFIDKISMKTTKCAHLYSYVLPRVTIWHSYAKTHLKKTKVALFFIQYFFYFFYFFYISKKLISYILSVCLVKKHTWDAYSFSKIVLCLTPKTMGLALNSRIFDTSNALWLTFPWVPVKQYPGISTVSILNFISILDLINVYIKSLIAPFSNTPPLRSGVDKIQHYISFDFFLVAHTLLIYLPHQYQDVFFANHYDRWAILIDHLSIKNKHLLQHGFILQEKIPFKLSTVSDLYYVNNQSKVAFQKYLFNTPQKIHYHKLTFSLNLSSVSNFLKEKRTSILLIGQTFNQEKEIELIKHILKKFSDVFIFIKPHPRYATKKYKYFSRYKKNVYYIENNHFFPKVNLAVTDRSWLGIEYELSGIQVIWTQDLSINTTINLIKNSLKTILAPID